VSIYYAAFVCREGEEGAQHEEGEGGDLVVAEGEGWAAFCECVGHERHEQLRVARP
jgi:hypothetical protein